MKRILIVDDSTFMRNILKELLLNNIDGKSLNQKVELFEADGKINALKQLETIKPDLILLDIVMRESETEGIELVEEIKNTFDVKKIIMISSIGQAAMLERCKNAGVVRYLQKPFDHMKVIDAVNDVLMK